ncbi:MAG TPA: glycosyltransferase [Geminicoccaceae bacterium]
MVFGAYIAVLLGLALNAPAALWNPEHRAFFLVVGTIGLWRYAWNLLHLLRSAWYRQVTFRRWRRLVDRLETVAAAEPGDAGEALRVPQVFVVVTSYRIRAETSALVFEAALREAIAYGRPATIVASVVELADQRLVKAVFARLAPPPPVRLVIVRVRGTGKRDALALALRAIARLGPEPDAAVILQDGDAILPPGCLARTLPFFRLMPDLAGLTTDEDCVVDGGGRWMRSWHRLRFAQRHLLMSSMALTGRLITLTGRMAVYPARVATDPGFIDIIQNDSLNHWRLGRFRLLTGEDKSTAYWLLRRGARMLYVPDVRVVTIEHPPAPDLPRASTMLMLRWFGNMLRASGRAIALGPRRLGFFLWWCLVDQRISMWTPLVGPVMALCLAVAATPAFLYAYLIWVMLTRLLQSLALLTVRPTIDGLYPALIYYNQLYGAFLKTWILFRLDRQRWTRQNIALPARLPPGRARLRALGSAYLHALALATLVAAVAAYAGLLPVPPQAANLASWF